MSKRFAAVDIGSNTIKVTIADYLGDHHFQKILYKDFSSGLGSSMSIQNIIEKSKLTDCYKAINDIKVIIERNEVETYKYVATHALREAVNQNEILNLIKSNTGVEIDIISGQEEARLTLKAILIDFPSSCKYACINAGGGSTELSFFLPDNSKTEQVYFFRFGAVNLYADYLQDKPDVENAIHEIGELINREFDKLNVDIPRQIDEVVSVGGSIYNAAYIFKKDKERDFESLSKMRLSVSNIESVINQLKFVDENEKRRIPGMDKKRIDTALPGVLIHYFLLKLLKKEELIISTRSISDGLIYTMAVKN